MQSSFKAKEDLPAVLSAKDISKYLGISKANSYQFMDSKGFPILRIGKRKLVPKDKFLYRYIPYKFWFILLLINLTMLCSK